MVRVKTTGLAGAVAVVLAVGLFGCAPSSPEGDGALSLSESVTQLEEAEGADSTASDGDSRAADDVEKGASDASASAAPRKKEDVTLMVVTQDTLLTDIAMNPAFDGYGYGLLPWHGAREEGYDLRNESALLPYHSDVRPQQAEAALNRLIADASEGRTVAFPVYSDAAMAADPDKADAVLYFFRGKPGAPFAIVNPGGGFSYVGSLHESIPHAQWLSEQGINAFSLSYREGSGQMAVEDLAQAITFIFRHADELEVSTQGYSLWGSSAGARMAAAIGSYGPAAFGGAELPRPAAVIMAYTGQSEYTASDPATYAVVGDRDGIAEAGVMERRIRGLQQAGVAADIVVYPGLSHGFGTGEGTAAEGWMHGALDFWLEHRSGK